MYETVPTPSVVIDVRLIHSLLDLPEFLQSVDRSFLAQANTAN